MRDDFSKQTVIDIGKGVGYRCSNPECQCATVAANAAKDGIITLGVAAHICAASSGGPRYDAAQTRAERRSTDNGIWLCQNCGRLIDADATQFTVEVLRGWKHAAQERALHELLAPRANAVELARIQAAGAAASASDTDTNFNALFERVRAAAQADLAGFTRAPLWSSSSIELTLRLFDDDKTPSFSISKLPPALEAAPEITIVAPPGTGKTTTVLQLARHALSSRLHVPFYFPLADWAAGSTALLASLRERPSFQDIGADQLQHLAEHGRLLLLLDGWNELDAASQQRLRREIDHIRRDWPHVRVVATTRRQMLDVPMMGPRIEIDPLSDGQELAIARMQSGNAGEKIVDVAWRTPGVRALIGIPLYLTALVAGGSEDSNATTKEGVLRLFVERHEGASEHAEPLLAALHGCHQTVLVTLASRMTESGATAMTETDARRVVTEALNSLRQEGQLVAIPEPLAVLNVLANHHTLVRSGGVAGAISFQHQQFQEWFASFEVTKLIRQAAGGDDNATQRLRAVVFDRPAWEEAIYFAVERLSREAEGAALVAYAIRLALGIDPMLAAEMIYRSGAAVWPLIQTDMVAFVRRWHTPGKVDRAVRFMIITGRPEFADFIWPLASSDDSQIQLPTLRTAPRFRPSVLGENLPSKVAALPEDVRKHLLALIAAESGADGIELAVELAKRDPSPEIQAEVVQYLQFRRADRHVAALLEAAHDGVWTILAKRGYSAEIVEPKVAARLRAERNRLLRESQSPAERLGLWLEQPPEEPGQDAGVADAIADPQFPVRDPQGGSLYVAMQRAPAGVLAGLKRRLEAGLEIPFHAEEAVEKLDTVDEGPIAAAILDISKDRRESHAIPALAGPKVVSALLDDYLQTAAAFHADRSNRAAGDKMMRLGERLRGVRPGALVSVVLAKADTDDVETISSLAHVIADHGDSSEIRKTPLPFGADSRSALTRVLRRWAHAVISSQQSKRYELNEVSNAIGRTGIHDLIPELKRLLDEELRRHEIARAGSRDARLRGDIDAASDASMYYTNQYHQAFSALGGEETARVVAGYLENREFGFDAALVLKNISDKALNVIEPGPFKQWPWFNDIKAAQARRVATPPPRPENDFANPIFAAIDRLANVTVDAEGQQLAIKLARVALAMPHANHDSLIDRVLALPQPLTNKRELLAAMVMDGRVLDSAMVMRAIDDWLEGCAQNAQNAWHKRQNTWEIEPWLELLPFTTEPDSVFNGLGKVKAFYGTGHAQPWERVLAAIAAVPGDAGDQLIARLAREHRDIATDHAWMRAILGRDTPSAVLVYVDLVIAGVFTNGHDAGNAWHRGRELAAFAKKYPELNGALKERYNKLSDGAGRAMLEQAFSEIGESADVMAMVRKYAADGQAYDGTLSAAVRAAAIDEVPVGDGSNAYNIHPAPVAELRKQLFDMAGGPPAQTILAKRCLTLIDKQRDEHGIAGNEPRHPDIISGRPWPDEAVGG